MDRGEAGAVIEHRVFNGRDALGDVDGGEAGAAIERTASDGRDPIRDDD